jgi:hypothetical protein
MSDAPLDRAQVLDELELLATVEHALIVEYLTVHCSLGHDLEAEQGGATTEQGRQASDAAASLAQGEMFRLKDVNRALVAAGRSAQLGRASSIAAGAAAAIPLDPPSRAQLEQLLPREDDLAAAVDAHYGRLRPAVTSDAVFDGDLLATIRSVVDDGTTHADSLAALREAMDDVPPAFFLRAIRRETNDAFEQRLLDVSDRGYQSIVAALGESFAQEDPFAGGAFTRFAVTAMMSLDDVHRLLVQRGLLPPFTLG